jgi:hypothetical protein
MSEASKVTWPSSKPISRLSNDWRFGLLEIQAEYLLGPLLSQKFNDGRIYMTGNLL